MAQIRLELREADGEVPAVCVCCGAPASKLVARKMSWFPRWTYWLILVHPFVMALVAAIMNRSARVRTPLCKRHERHWFNRTALIWLAGLVLCSAAGAIFMTVASADVDAHPRAFDDRMLFASMAGSGLLVLWLIIIWVIQGTAIRPLVITKTEIVLVGVCEAFVKAVQEADLNRLDGAQNTDEIADSGITEPTALNEGIQAERIRQSDYPKAAESPSRSKPFSPDTFTE